MNNLDYKISFMVYSPYGEDYDNNYDSELKLFNYNESMVSLGLSTKETFDKSLDTASIEILLSNRPNEFQPYTMASLLVYTTDEAGTKVKEGKYNLFVIEEDLVEEQYIGTETRYNHKITLVEATKLLETELMPNITFTQPVKNIQLGQSWGKYVKDKEATSNLTTLGKDARLSTLMTSVVAPTVTVAEFTIIGAALGGLAGAIIGVVIGNIEAVINTYTHHNESLTTLGALSFTQNIPDQKIGATLAPGMLFPMITNTIDINSFVESCEIMFGDGGIWEGVLVGAIPLYGLIALIAKLFALIGGDVSPKIYQYPCAVIAYNKDTKEVFKLSEDPEFEEEVSSEKYLGNNVGKWQYYHIPKDSEIKVPDNITPGKYTVYYLYNLEKLWLRNFEWWPFNMPWDDAEIDKDLGNGLTIRDLLEAAQMIVIDDLEATQDSINLGLGRIDASYDLNPIYMDELLTRIESQITCNDRIKLYDTETEMTTYLNNDIIHAASKFKLKVNNNNEYLDFNFNIYNNNSLNLRPSNLKYKNNILMTVYGNIYFYDNNNKYVGNKEIKNFDTLIPALKYKNVSFEIPIVKGAAYYTININVEKSTNGTSDGNISNVSLTDFKRTVYGYPAPKYKFSEKAKALSKNIICPEFTFEKQTLWEVCNQIGEVLNGIPRLLEGNIIDFDIVTDNRNKEITFNKDSQSSSYNMINYATRLYNPELKNIISDENDNLAVFPYDKGWATVRAENYNTTNIDRQSSVLCIENDENSSIYQVKRLLVRTIIKGVYKEFNISNFIVEKKIWDTLSTNVDTGFGQNHEVSEKGLYCYYIRGKNSIYNLAQLPENRSLIEWKQQYLTIQFILSRQYNVPLEDSSKNIFDYEFRVEYYPYNTHMSIIRNSNLSDIYQQVSSNFNQTTKNISTSNYGKASQNMLETMCKPTITTSYTSNIINDDINIGDCISLKGRKYYINNKLTTYNNVDKTVTLELSRDNYKQNERIAVSREYRPYNIDSSNLVRKTLSKPYTIIVSAGNTFTRLNSNSNYIKEYSSANKHTIAKSIIETLEKGHYNNFNKITAAYVEPLDKLGEPIKYNTFRTDVSPSTAKAKLLPVESDCIGNTITLQWNMYDNFSAGRMLKDPSTGTWAWFDKKEMVIGGTYDPEKGTTVGGLRLKEKDYGLKFQTDSRYCDDIGSTDMFYTSFMAPDIKHTYSVSKSLPDTTMTRNGITSSSFYTLSNTIMAHKDCREKLSYQMTISAHTFDPLIDICSLMKYNPLVYSYSLKRLEWYGYTEENIPDDSGYYTATTINGRKAEYKLSYDIHGPKEYNGNPYVYCSVYNNTQTDFIGYVLINPGNSEILLNINKPIKRNNGINVGFTVFNSEISCIDTTDYTAPAPKARLLSGRAVSNEGDAFILLKTYTPNILRNNGKYYLDLTSLPYNLNDVEIRLVTKHNSPSRGIRSGKKKRTRTKRNTSLIKISNTYLDNPEYKQVTGRQPIVVTKKLFNKININPDTGELYYYDDKNVAHNISEYLNYKEISSQDLKGDNNTLSYGFALCHKEYISNYEIKYKYTYDKNSKKAINVEEI